MTTQMTLPALSLGILVAGALALPATAAAPTPRLVAAELTALRSSDGDVGLRAVVRLDRAPAPAQRRGLGLLAAGGPAPRQVANGAALPDALFGGTSLGRIGVAGRHCYVAEVAQLRAHRSVTLGTPWRLVLHDGRRVTGSGLQVTLRAQVAAEDAAARRLGCL